MTLPRSLALALLWLAASLPCPAQLPGNGQGGINATLLQLFGGLEAFVAKAEVVYHDRDTRQQATMPMGFSLLDGKLRLEFDLSQIRSAQVPTQMLANLKMASLDKMVTIVRPEQRKVLLLYPGAASYVEMPMAKEEAQDWQRHYSIQRTKLAQETVEGQPCDKQRVTVSTPGVPAQEATVWYSRTARPHPVKLQMNQPGATVTMVFREASLTRPAAAQFEIGAGLTRYPTVETLTQTALIKALSGGKPAERR